MRVSDLITNARSDLYPDADLTFAMILRQKTAYWILKLWLLRSQRCLLSLVLI